MRQGCGGKVRLDPHCKRPVNDGKSLRISNRKLFEQAFVLGGWPWEMGKG